MKILLLALALPLALFTSTSTDVFPVNTSESTELHEEVKTRYIEVIIGFGRASKRCKGFGICKIKIKKGKKVRGRSAKVYVNNGVVTSLEVLNEGMDKKTAKKYFGDGVFVVEEDFSTKLKYEGESIIFNLKAGKYKVKRTEEGFNIGMPPM